MVNVLPCSQGCGEDEVSQCVKHLGWSLAQSKHSINIGCAYGRRTAFRSGSTHVHSPEQHWGEPARQAGSF